MSSETSPIRRTLAGLAALAVAAASLAVLPQPAQTSGSDEHLDGETCVTGCDSSTQMCCMGGF